MSDSETILQSVQDTLYLLTLDEYAPSSLLPRISHTAEWPSLVLKLIDRTIGSGIARLLTYRDVSFDDAMRSLVQHPIGNEHDDDWHGFQLASTDQGLAMIAALGIFDLDQPTTDAMRIQATEWGFCPASPIPPPSMTKAGLPGQHSRNSRQSDSGQIEDERRGGWIGKCPRGHLLKSTLLKAWGADWIVHYDRQGSFVAITEARSGVETEAAITAVLHAHGQSPSADQDLDTVPQCPICGTAIPFEDGKHATNALWIENQLLVDIFLARVSRLASVDVT